MITPTPTPNSSFPFRVIIVIPEKAGIPSHYSEGKVVMLLQNAAVRYEIPAFAGMTITLA